MSVKQKDWGVSELENRNEYEILTVVPSLC